MTGHDDARPLGDRVTEIDVAGANCSWCFNDALDRLRRLPGVMAVRGSITSECVEVAHHDVPVTVLVDTLRSYLHGTDNTSHECQMVAVEPRPIRTSGADAFPMPTAPSSKVPMETLTDAMRRLRAAGYTANFSATADGRLRCRTCGTTQGAETVRIDETVRFEGESNPDDEAILLALVCAGGCRGQYVAAFGADTPEHDVDVLRHLSRIRS